MINFLGHFVCQNLSHALKCLKSIRDKLMNQKKVNDSKVQTICCRWGDWRCGFIVDIDIQVSIDIYEPFIEREAENKVSDDTIETLSVSEVDAEGEVFGDADETPKLEGTTLPLPIHEPYTQSQNRLR